MCLVCQTRLEQTFEREKKRVHCRCWSRHRGVGNRRQVSLKLSSDNDWTIFIPRGWGLWLQSLPAQVRSRHDWLVHVVTLLKSSWGLKNVLKTHRHKSKGQHHPQPRWACPRIRGCECCRILHCMWRCLPISLHISVISDLCFLSILRIIFSKTLNNSARKLTLLLSLKCKRGITF